VPVRRGQRAGIITMKSRITKTGNRHMFFSRRRVRVPASRARKAAVAGIVVVAAGASVFFLVLALGQSPERESYSVNVSESAGEYKPRVEEYARQRPKLEFTDDASSADIAIDNAERKDMEFCRVIRETPGMLVKAGDTEVEASNAYTTYLNSRYDDGFTRDLAVFLEEPPPEVRLVACGDVIPGRHVAEKMAQHGVLYPFERVAPYLKGADIVYANLECPLSDRVEPPYTGMEFVAPTKTADGLKLCGIDVVSLANNHSTDFGPEVFADTLEVLKENGIEYVGGGTDADEAFTPVYLEANGVRFAFLNYNAVNGPTVDGAVGATDTRAGVANIQLEPYSPDDPDDFDLVEQQVGEAAKNADVLVACFHWGPEEVYEPNQSMVKMAHTACDAGADLVIGTHPHSVQSVEYYNGSFIAYSLGNFVFDQMFSTQVREGIVLDCTFGGDELAVVELVPYKIYDYCQPVVLSGTSGRYLLDHAVEISSLAD
jgi:poly-gamma-glutamate capsule biosynthesis protein CapA/YwtB (metallophosphatase superfamily)